MRQSLFAMSLLSLFWGCGMPDAEDELGTTVESVTISDAVYEVRSVLSDKCAAVSGGSQTVGAQVVQLACNGSASRTFALRRLSGDVYTLTAGHTGQCLSVDSDSSSNGRTIVQSPCKGAPNQQWLLVATGSNYLLKPKTTGSNGTKCLDLTASSLDSGAALLQWTCHNLPNQQWRLAPVGGSDDGSGTPSGTAVSYTDRKSVV